MDPVLAAQHRRLLNSLLFVVTLVGLWSIYSKPSRPSPSSMDTSLWTYTGTLDGQAHILSVTVADIGLILIITTLAALAIKNLPALLEVLLLQCSPISSGSCYTVKGQDPRRLRHRHHRRPRDLQPKTSGSMCSPWSCGAI